MIILSRKELSSDPTISLPLCNFFVRHGTKVTAIYNSVLIYDPLAWPLIIFTQAPPLHRCNFQSVQFIRPVTEDE